MLFGLAVLAAATFAAATRNKPPAGFAASFRDSTMRVDYYHTGDAGRESFAIDRVVSDGRWAGSRTILLDTLNLGTWRFTVFDSAGGAPLYSRGYSSLYAEWERTNPSSAATFHESLRFPWPHSPVKIVLERRDQENHWIEAWTVHLSPGDLVVNPAEPRLAGKVWTVFENGPPSSKVDLVLVSEGYTAAEMGKFHADVARLVDTLFRTEPFRSRRGDFNVRAVDLPSPESGINSPTNGRFRRTPLSASFGIFGLERYMLTEDNRALRNALAGVPYEFLEILANDTQYGGGGIYNFQAATAARAPFAEYVFIHEFGHHFAGLADEYYTAPVAYQTGAPHKVEPWELNVTALHDPARLKWRDLVGPGIPLPTPWPKAEYEEMGRTVQVERERLIAAHAGPGQMDSLFQAQRRREDVLLGGASFAGKVGAFEGAADEATGLFRPEINCIMLTRSATYCRVCSRAITAVIDQYVAP
ncbi:MAG: peptidase M64 [Gemmatimonadales bacterium]|nr:MAG: peptidase M64 [Gemmatimonadales bacterium]